MTKRKNERQEGTQFACGGCGEKFTATVAAGEGVVCPGCGKSDQLSSESKGES